MKNGILAFWFLFVLALSLAAVAVCKVPFWWSSEYSSLVRLVEKQKDRTMGCSYRAGDDARSLIQISITIEKKGTLLMKIEGAGQNIVDNDEDAATYEPRSGRAAFYFRDANRDGMPDQIKDESNPGPTEKLRYYNLSEYEDPDGLLALWNIGIGYSINKLLHGIDSALPRKER